MKKTSIFNMGVRLGMAGHIKKYEQIKIQALKAGDYDNLTDFSRGYGSGEVIFMVMASDIKNLKK